MDQIIALFSPHGTTGKKAPPEGFNKCARALFFGLDNEPVNWLTHSPAAPYLWPLFELFTNIWPEDPQVHTIPPSNWQETFCTSTSPLEIFEKPQCAAVASVQHSCSRGITAEGRTAKAIVQEMVPPFDDSMRSMSDKLQIFTLQVLYQPGVPDEDRR
ncbi:hypothetical protein O181_107284 [Austropuccinia psidii MF-1]|uniref:Uncharacterized protein n=1 Tax=Austropuccinia psidii MF-1 TaxID=1389203 RepID=A0A9Q3JSU5_9BASI|nr:hypothetical protein [Austropuccinia psidii MF-1]